MKTITTFLAIFLLPVFAFGQKPEYGNIKLKLDSAFLKSDGEFGFQFMEKFLYNSNGTVLESLVYQVEEINGALVPTYKSEYDLDDQGNISTTINYEWDGAFSTWSRIDKIEYSFDSNGKVTSLIEYSWRSGTNDWEADAKLEYTYGTVGEILQALHYTWDRSSGQWENRYLYEYIYDEDGNRSQNKTNKWDESISAWRQIDKTEYSYNDSGNISQSLYYYLDEDTGVFIESWKEEYTYDEYGNISQKHIYEKIEETGGLFLLGKYEYNYDNSFSFSDLILPIANDEISITEAFDLSYLFRHKLDSFISLFWDTEIEDWVEALSGNYYYSPHIAGSVEEIEIESISIFPNPADNIININGLIGPAEVKIYNTKGQLLKTLPHVESKIDISEILPGIYFLHISTQGEKTIQKVLIE